MKRIGTVPVTFSLHTGQMLRVGAHDSRCSKQDEHMVAEPLLGLCENTHSIVLSPYMSSPIEEVVDLIEDKKSNSIHT